MSGVFGPREHGLWAWVAVPQLAAVALRPGLPAVAGAFAVLGGFAASNALRRGARGPAIGASLAACVPAAVHFASAPRPMVTAVTFAALAGVALLLPRRMPRHALAEVGGILALAGLGGGVALAAGADAGRTAAVELVVATWAVFGLWWIRGALAPLLAGREPWTGGAPTCLALAAITVAVGVLAGEPLVGLVPLLYPLRTWLHRPPSRAADARRVGLAELGWAVGAALVAVAA